VYRQADFFGAMDGAGKFVRGDAIAGVVILLVNISGGLFLGLVNYHMSLGDAVGVYTKLTIGDGLVSQVPAFLISLAAGLIVTRSSSSTDLGRDVIGQLFWNRGVMGTAAVFLCLLAFTPLPKIPLLALAGGLGAGAVFLRPQDEEHEQGDGSNERSGETQSRGGGSGISNPRKSGMAMESLAVRKADRGAVGGTSPQAGAGGTGREGSSSEGIEDLLQVDPLELEIGFRLIGLADPTRGGDLLERLRTVRQRVARELGLIVPQVRIHDEIGVAPNEYRVKIRGTVVGHGTAYSGRLLAIPPSGLVNPPDGRESIDPISGLPAVWIHADGREVAELAGCQILDASAVVAGHFGEIVRNHADELLTREQIERLLDRVRATAPTLVAEVLPALLRPGEVQRVLQNLLRERVSVRDLETILETLAVHAGKTRDVDALTEQVRQSLGRQITESYRGSDGRLRVVTLSRPLDARLTSASTEAESRPAEILGEEMAQSIVRAVAMAVGSLIEAGVPPVILTSAPARAPLKDLTRADLPRLVVLSQREIPRDTPIEILGSVIEEAPEAVTTFSTIETIA
jgi:flagellar biosynthesis protein FlhA